MDVLDLAFFFTERVGIWEQVSQRDKAKKRQCSAIATGGFFNAGAMPLKGWGYGSIKRGFVSRKSTENIVARAVFRVVQNLAII